MPFKLPIRLNADLAKRLLNDVDNFLFDCDGVVWNWPKAIQGSVECINKLKELGKNCYFVTNNNSKTRQMVIDQINKVGIKNVAESDIVCTAWVLAGYLKSIEFKDKCYVIGSQAIAHELNLQGIKHTGIGSNVTEFPDPLTYDFKNSLNLDAEVKAVVVGFDHYFNYPKMVLAATYLHRVPDCLFVATNDDAIFPTESSKAVIPGTGSFVSAIKAIAGRDPLILGKPNKTMWEILMKANNLNPQRTCMVGDRLDTDIAFAANCSLGYSLAVLTGITNVEEIEGLAKKSQAENSNDADVAKCLPDFYAQSLGELLTFII